MSISEAFLPVSGTISGHLFENQNTGVKRDIYWSIEVEFDEFDLGGNQEQPLFQVEWIKSSKAAPVLKNGGRFSSGEMNSYEASCYFENSHQPVEFFELEIFLEQEPFHYVLGYSFGFSPDSAQPPIVVRGVINAAMAEIAIVKQTFGMQGRETADAVQMLRQDYGDTSGLICNDQEFKFSFVPKITPKSL